MRPRSRTGREIDRMHPGIGQGHNDPVQRSRGRVVANVLGGLALAMALAGALLVATQHNLDPAPPRSAGPGSSMESLLANDWFMLSRAISAALFAVAGWYLATRRPGVV